MRMSVSRGFIVAVILAATFGSPTRKMRQCLRDRNRNRQVRCHNRHRGRWTICSGARSARLLNVGMVHFSTVRRPRAHVLIMAGSEMAGQTAAIEWTNRDRVDPTAVS